jgi:hypothetical protein
MIHASCRVILFEDVVLEIAENAFASKELHMPAGARGG